jgi:hypothetical protein
MNDKVKEQAKQKARDARATRAVCRTPFVTKARDRARHAWAEGRIHRMVVAALIAVLLTGCAPPVMESVELRQSIYLLEDEEGNTWTECRAEIVRPVGVPRRVPE